MGGNETGVATYEAVTGEEAYTGRGFSSTEQGERYGNAAVGLFDIAASGRSALKGRFGGGGGNKCGKGGTCFSAGTLVMTADGLVAIEEIEVGDEVYAYDFETESVEVCVVEEVLSNYTYNWVEICTADGGEITSTRSHRFWSLLDQDWVTAVELHSGDLLYSADGTAIQVLSASVRALDEPETTYNLEVQRCHSYYVGAFGALVHNDGEGSYEIWFKSGFHYEGKGDISRAMQSAAKKARINGGVVVRIEHAPANGSADSFAQEELRMRKNGDNVPNPAHI